MAEQLPSLEEVFRDERLCIIWWELSQLFAVPSTTPVIEEVSGRTKSKSKRKKPALNVNELIENIELAKQNVHEAFESVRREVSQPSTGGHTDLTPPAESSGVYESVASLIRPDRLDPRVEEPWYATIGRFGGTLFVTAESAVTSTLSAGMGLIRGGNTALTAGRTVIEMTGMWWEDYGRGQQWLTYDIEEFNIAVKASRSMTFKENVRALMKFFAESNTGHLIQRLLEFVDDNSAAFLAGFLITAASLSLVLRSPERRKRWKTEAMVQIEFMIVSAKETKDWLLHPMRFATYVMGLAYSRNYMSGYMVVTSAFCMWTTYFTGVLLAKGIRNVGGFIMESPTYQLIEAYVPWMAALRAKVIESKTQDKNRPIEAQKAEAALLTAKAAEKEAETKRMFLEAAMNGKLPPEATVAVLAWNSGGQLALPAVQSLLGITAAPSPGGVRVELLDDVPMQRLTDGQRRDLDEQKKALVHAEEKYERLRITDSKVSRSRV